MNQRHVIARGLRLAMSAAELPVLVLVKPSWRPKPKPPRKDRWVGWPEVQLERIRTHEVAMQEWHEWKLQHDEEMLVWTRHEKRQRYERNRDKAAHNHADLQDIDQNASQLSPQPAVGPITFAELCDRLARAVVEASTPLPLPPPLPPSSPPLSAATAEVSHACVVFEEVLPLQMPVVTTVAAADVLLEAARCNYSAATPEPGKPPPVFILSLDRPQQFERLLEDILPDYRGAFSYEP